MKIRIVELYKKRIQNNSFADYIKTKNIEFDTFWFLTNRPEKLFFRKSEILIRELSCIFLLLISIRGFYNKKVLSFGGHYSLLLISRFLGIFLGSGFHLYIYNFYLHGAGSRKMIKTLMHFLLNTKFTTLIVQSPEELVYYNSISKNSVHFIPYCEDPGYEMSNNSVISGNYFFTGGYSNRDYSLVLECAVKNPSVKFVLVVSQNNQDFLYKRTPDNVILFKEIDSSAFNELMFKSYAVIIPLKDNVGASGQMLCLKAMKMAKPIIYCDISSINFYFNNNLCGIPYSIGDLRSLNNAIQKVLSEESNLKAMGENAYSQFIEHFTLNKRNERFLDLLLNNQN